MPLTASRHLASLLLDILLEDPEVAKVGGLSRKRGRAERSWGGTYDVIAKVAAVQGGTAL